MTCYSLSHNQSMEWRWKYKIDTLVEDYKAPEVLTKYFSAGHVGVDKHSSYLMVVRYGATDLKGILQSVKKKDYVMHIVELVERSIRIVRNNQTKYKRRPDAINQACVIMDMAGFSMRHVTYKPGTHPHNYCSLSLNNDQLILIA